MVFHTTMHCCMYWALLSSGSAVTEMTLPLKSFSWFIFIYCKKQIRRLVTCIRDGEISLLRFLPKPLQTQGLLYNFTWMLSYPVINTFKEPKANKDQYTHQWFLCCCQVRCVKKPSNLFCCSLFLVLMWWKQSWKNLFCFFVPHNDKMGINCSVIYHSFVWVQFSYD